MHTQNQRMKEKILTFLCEGADSEKLEHVTKKDYPEKRLSSLGIGEAFIVVHFTSKGHPICQMVHDLQNDMSNGFSSDKTFFTISKEVVQKLEAKKTYRVVKGNNEGTRMLSQVDMFITEDVILG